MMSKMCIDRLNVIFTFNSYSVTPPNNGNYCIHPLFFRLLVIRLVHFFHLKFIFFISPIAHHVCKLQAN